MECALKAAVAAQVNQGDFPDKKLAEAVYTRDVVRLRHLLLTLPATATDPAQSVHARLLDILKHAPGVEHFSFDSVGLMPPENALIELLSTAIQTPVDAVAGIRFSNNTINGQLIPDAYIYRLTRPGPERIAVG